MEIIDFLRGRWLAIVIAAPILAGAIAYLLFSALQEDRHVTRTRVGQLVHRSPSRARGAVPVVVLV